MRAFFLVMWECVFGPDDALVELVGSEFCLEGLDGCDSATQAHLYALGFVPKVTIRLLEVMQGSDMFIVQVGPCQIALKRSMWGHMRLVHLQKTYEVTA